MHFCDKCQNMFYIRLNEDSQDSIIYYCKNCGNENHALSKENICVSSVNYRETTQNFNHIINEYTKLDPTLPRISSIRCPNADCESNSDEEKREVIYIRYDDTNMKYIYLCAVCNTSWKTDQQN